MNERMYELINEAFIGTTDGKLSELNTVKNIEKFAELIVRECGLLADQYQFEKNTPNPLRVKRLDLVPSEFIKKHFGVEE